MREYGGGADSHVPQASAGAHSWCSEGARGGGGVTVCAHSCPQEPPFSPPRSLSLTI